MAENNVGLTLKYSNKQVADAMESIGYTPYNVSPEDLQKLTAIAMQLSDWQCKAVAAMNYWWECTFVEEANIMLQADEIPFHEFGDFYSTLNDDEKVGYYMFDNGMVPADVQALYDGPHGCYVDVEMYGRALQASGDVDIAEDGFLFCNAGLPDTDRYSEEEIDEWIRDNA